MSLDSVASGGAVVDLTAALWQQVTRPAPSSASEGPSLPDALPPAQASLGRLIDLVT